MTDAASRKPWYRVRNLVLFAITVIMIWLGYWVWWAMTATPTISVDYTQRLGELSAAAQPDGEDAWPHVIALGAALDQLTTAFPEDDRPAAHRGGIDFDLLYDREVDYGGSPESDEFLHRVLDRAAADGLIEIVATIRDCPRMVRAWPTDGRPMIGVLLPELAQMRQVARLRVAMMRRAAHDGDGEDVVEAVADLMALGTHLSHEPLLVSWLSSVGIRLKGLEEIRALARSGRLDAGTLEGALELLARDADECSPSLALEGERGFVLDMIQRVYTDDGQGDGRLLPAELANFDSTITGLPGRPAGELGRLRNLFGVVSANRSLVTSRANELYDRMIAICEMVPNQRPAAIDELHSEIQDLGSGYGILQLLIPAFSNALEVGPSADAHLGATRLILAIELHRLRSGTLPEDLAALEPLFPDGLPTDPFHGGTFGYRVIPEGYLVYTFGYDATDDDGKVDGHRAIRGRNKGVDFVFE